MTAVQCAVPAGDLLGETPLWCVPSQSLLWLDIDDGRLHRFHPGSGRHDCFAFREGPIGTLALTGRPEQVLLGIGVELHWFDLGTGALRWLCRVEPGDRGTRLNDGRCDGQGRLWVGTMDIGLREPRGAFYSVGAQGKVRRHFGDVIVANSVAFSPDRATLYFSDTRRFVTWQFTMGDGVGPGPRRVFVDHSATQSRPDGACVDREGHVWVAIFGEGRIVRFKPDGRVDREVGLPVTNPTCACLGGPDLKTLYITTARKFLDAEQLRAEPLAGAVLRLEVDVPGLPEFRFGEVAARL